MEPFEPFTGRVAPLDVANVDTDQIIPKQFLKRVERSGFGDVLFHDWRTREDGSQDPDFVLNDPPYRDAEILLARENFGCGSSREHAVWALGDAGFRAIIAPSFADIFQTNAFKNGLLPIALDADIVDDLFRRLRNLTDYAIAVDLANQRLDGSDGGSLSFEIDPFRKRCLLEGLDEIALTLEHEAEISAYEAAHDVRWQARVAGAEGPSHG
ncbi:MAG: 3-isopropylmalate dehydratase small subunit [Candidatus Bipolaricaulia bacterium]